jgi:hypothetical protein
MTQRGVVAGFVFFPAARELLTNTTIEAYSVSVVDTFDKESQREVLLLSEHPNERVEKASRPAQ